MTVTQDKGRMQIGQQIDHDLPPAISAVLVRQIEEIELSKAQETTRMRTVPAAGRAPRPYDAD
jgi:hypothetical protein